MECSIKFNTVDWLLAGTHTHTHTHTHTDGWLDDTQAGWHTQVGWHTH